MAAAKKQVLECRFYRTAAGNEPVREWLKSLPKGTRLEIGSDIQQVQRRWPVGKPLVDGFGKGLFEIRTGFEGNIYRVLLLHGFQKKSQKTPKTDLDLARQRMQEVE